MIIKLLRVYNDAYYLHIVNMMRGGIEITMTVRTDSQVFSGIVVASHPEQMAFSLVVTDRISLKES